MLLRGDLEGKGKCAKGNFGEGEDGWVSKNGEGKVSDDLIS